ncbi:MAG: winged helix-turn-helix domain-containing protein [Pseudomonadota bacterium]
MERRNDTYELVDAGDAGDVTMVGPLRIDRRDQRLLTPSGPVDPGRRGFAVLTALVSAGGHLVTKDDLFAAAWGDMIVSDCALTSAIRDLRRTLALAYPGSDLIETVYGRGYRLRVAAKDRAAAADIPAAAIAGPTAPDWRAFRLYLDAQAKLAAGGTNHVEQALDDLHASLEIDDRFALGWAALARTLHFLPDWPAAEALAAAERAHALDPHAHDIVSTLANCHYQVGDFEAAAATFASIDAETADATSLRRRGTFLLATGEIDAAVDMLRAAVIAEPRAALPAAYFATALAIAGRTTDSRDLFAGCIDLTDVNTHVALLATLAALGEGDPARIVQRLNPWRDALTPMAADILNELAAGAPDADAMVARCRQDADPEAQLIALAGVGVFGRPQDGMEALLTLLARRPYFRFAISLPAFAAYRADPDFLAPVAGEGSRPLGDFRAAA